MATTLPAPTTLRMRRGDGGQVQLDFKIKPDADPKTKPVAYPIVAGDHEVTFTIKRTVDDPDPGVLQRKLTSGHMTISLTVPSRVFVLIPSGVSQNFSGEYLFDAQVVELATGLKKTAVVGTITFDSDVTAG